MSVTVRIGTRGSQLALWQANEVAKLLRTRGFQSEIIPFKTTADKRQDVPLERHGGIAQLEAIGHVSVPAHAVRRREPGHPVAHLHS